MKFCNIKYNWENVAGPSSVLLLVRPRLYGMRLCSFVRVFFVWEFFSYFVTDRQTKIVKQIFTIITSDSWSQSLPLLKVLIWIFLPENLRNLFRKYQLFLCWQSVHGSAVCGCAVSHQHCGSAPYCNPHTGSIFSIVNIFSYYF